MFKILFPIWHKVVKGKLPTQMSCKVQIFGAGFVCFVPFVICVQTTVEESAFLKTICLPGSHLLIMVILPPISLSSISFSYPAHLLSAHCSLLKLLSSRCFVAAYLIMGSIFFLKLKLNGTNFAIDYELSIVVQFICYFGPTFMLGEESPKGKSF